MTRTSIQSDWTIEPVEANLSHTDDLYNWLWDYAHVGDYLLVYDFDGVIWGRFDEDNLMLSHDFAPAISPSLELETLQSLRLFNADQELHLWRDGIGWSAQLARETPGSSEITLVEHYILLGTTGIDQGNDFTLMQSGAQGLQHIVPISATHVNDKQTRARLRLHHRCVQNPVSGVTFIAYSRLAGIEV